MPDDEHPQESAAGDPLDTLDRGLGIATKAAALPLLIDALLGLLGQLLSGGCTACMFVGMVIVLYAVAYPWWTLTITLALVGLGIWSWASDASARRRRPGPRRGGR